MVPRRALVPLALASGALVACVMGASQPAVVAAAPAATAAPAGQAAAAASAAAVSTAGDAEGEFLADINRLRTSNGLGALVVDPGLTEQARIWASTMHDAGRIYHSGDLSGGVSANWRKLGENVGVGGDVAALFQAFVDSPSHYENLVDPAYTHIGVGVVLSADGSQMYTAHRFMSLMPDTPPTPAARPATQPPPGARDTPPITAAPTTEPPTTAPPATEPPTTAPQAPRPKLGPIDRIAALIAGG